MTAPDRPKKRRASAGKTNLVAVAELADVSDAPSAAC
jgi:hypothetical protein